jgi:hypothetical protein
MGDEFELGPVTVQVALTVPGRPVLRTWDVLLATVLVLVALVQVAAAFWLLTTP